MTVKRNGRALSMVSALATPLLRARTVQARDVLADAFDAKVTQFSGVAALVCGVVIVALVGGMIWYFYRR